MSVFAVLAVLLAAVLFKLVDLQLIDPDAYQAMSEKQRMFEHVIPAERGAIVDRSGVELAVSVPQDSVYIDPGMIEDPAATAAAVAPILDITEESVHAAIGRGGRFAYLARHVPDETAGRIRELELPGVATVSEPKRFLPSGDVARSVVGLTDIDGLGLSGLEAQYADVLTGQAGSLTVERGRDGRTIPVGERELIPAQPGSNLVLTLDRSLQYEAERILSTQVAKVGARGGVALVTRPATGEVLAMANVTRVDETGEVEVDINNAAVTTSYEPGSVMKMITVSGAVEEGLVDWSTTVEVADSLRLGDYQFSEHTPHGTVNWAIPEILSSSSNVGTIRVAQMLGEDGLYQYLRSFGLGDVTTVGFPNEQAGFIDDPSDWSGSSIGSISIGQGIAVTPLQMAMAFNVIANGGVYVPPRLVAATVNPSGERHELPTGEPRQVVSRDTADMMNMMLRGVVAVGTGQKAAVNGYTVAGKTGTAAKPQPTGSYLDAAGNMQYRATFIGFAPAEDPALSILVMIDEPSNGDIYGGSLAAPVFSELARVALRILDVPPPATDRATRFIDALPEAAKKVDAKMSQAVTNAAGQVLATEPGSRVRATAVAAPPTTTAPPRRTP